MAVTRKLAAILAADVAGYSKLAGADEERTLARLRALRSDLIDPTVAVHHGRVVKRTGDGSLIEFRSVVDAVRCAIEVQSSMVERNAGLSPERRIEFRVGIHLGDVVEESDGDLMGDGVNIAARLEGIAQPGGICLSEDAYRQVKARLELAVSDLGATHLKNIVEPIRVYSLEIGSPVANKPETQVMAAAPKEMLGLTLPEKPSIAVLPFQNMSGDPEQEYIADGVVEEIITALSRFRHFFVIARNSSFTYKGRSVDVKQVGRELGVRYVLEGSVRKAANRLRITGQLIDAATAAHLWADRFEGELKDIFDLQDKVTQSVVVAIAPKLDQAEIDRVKHKPTENLNAYDYFLQGLENFYRFTRVGNDEALTLFSRVIELDPEFASAYGMAAACYDQRILGGWVIDRTEEVREAKRLAQRAIELGRDDALALCGAASLLVRLGDLNAGAVFLDRALAPNPNLPGAWSLSSFVKILTGELETAIERLAHVMRLSPRDPNMYMYEDLTGLAHLLAGRNDEASLWAEQALRDKADFHPALRIAAASHALAGRLREAQHVMARLRELDPAMRISNFKGYTPLFRPEHFAKFVEGLRIAGLPE
jgi:TolB-like protein